VVKTHSALLIGLASLAFGGLVVVLPLITQGCDAVPDADARFRTVRVTRTSGDDSHSVSVIQSTRTGKCYLGIYNVGLVEVPAEECR